MLRIIVSMFIVLAQAGVTATSTGAAQTPATALCDAVAASIRADKSDDPLKPLSQGDPPNIEISSKPEMRAVSDPQFLNSFRDKFKPPDTLAKSLGGFTKDEEGAEVYSLPDSDLHMVERSSGTARCEGFLFFQTFKSRESQLLPKLPPKGTSDGDNAICDGYGDDGHFARIAGTDVFLESMIEGYDYQDPESMSRATKYQFRIVPFDRDHWANGCRVEVDFSIVADHKALQSVRVTPSP